MVFQDVWPKEIPCACLRLAQIKEGLECSVLGYWACELVAVDQAVEAGSLVALGIGLGLIGSSQALYAYRDGSLLKSILNQSLTVDLIDLVEASKVF